jgi:uncharacterized protein
LRRLALAALLAMGCAPNKAEPGTPGARVVVETAAGAKHAVRVELARTDPQREVGLMNRPKLADDAGMLFLFEDTAERAFWMRNTLIPLDILFIDEEGRIVGIVEGAEPLSERSRTVGRPSRYVLEVNGGWSAAHGVRAGDRVRFEKVPRF